MKPNFSSLIMLALYGCGSVGPDEPAPEAPAPAPVAPDTHAADIAVCTAARDATLAYCTGCIGKPLEWCQVYGWFIPCDGTHRAAVTPDEYRTLCGWWWEDRLAACDLGVQPSDEPPSCTLPFDPSDGV